MFYDTDLYFRRLIGYAIFIDVVKDYGLPPRFALSQFTRLLQMELVHLILVSLHHNTFYLILIALLTKSFMQCILSENVKGKDKQQEFALHSL